MSISYASLNQLETELNASGGTATEQARLLNYGKQITERVDEYIGYGFAPRIETIYHDLFRDLAYTNRGDPSLLTLRQPYLSITSVSNRDTSLTAWDETYSNQSSADYYAEPLDNTPKLRLIRLQGLSWYPSSYTYLSDLSNAVKVTGVTGYRTRYPSEGFTEIENLPSSIAASATSINVSDGTVYSAGMMLRITDEFLAVTDVSSNTLTVERGIRGSTAALHTTDDSIEIWKPEPTIVRAVTRWANYLHSRRGNFETFTVDGLGASTQMPADMPKEVQNILDNYPTIPLNFYSP